jgi:PAS domain S-box-containing protein
MSRASPQAGIAPPAEDAPRDCEGSFELSAILAHCVGLDGMTDADRQASIVGFRSLLAAVPAAIYITDAAGRITFYNNAAAALWRHRPALGTSAGADWWTLFRPDGSVLPHDQSPMAMALKEKRPIRGFEAIAGRADGTRVPFAPYPTPVFDASGVLRGVVNMLVDLTDRKRAEDMPLARETELEAVVNRTPFLLIRCSRDMRYRFVSEAYAQMIGRRPEELIGRAIGDIIGQEALDTIRPHIERVLQGHRTEYETEVHFAGVGPRLLRAIYTPDLDERGNTNGWIASIHDISERRHAERIRQLLASIVDSSDDAIVSKDLNGVIASWNRGAERLFGYAADEAVGRPITMLIPEALQDEEPRFLERIRRGECVEHYETVRRRKDGGMIHVSLTVSPVRNEEGKIIGASKIARNITDRRRAETALARRAAEKAALYEFTNRLYRAGSLTVIYEAALDAIIGALGCSRASILLFDARGIIRFVAWRGLSERFRKAAEGRSPWSPDDINPQPICIDDAARAGDALSVKTEIAREGIRAVAFIPLVVQGRLAGKFMAYYEAVHTFSKDEIDLALNLARQLGFAIERTRAEEARRVAERELRALSEKLESEVERRTRERDQIWNVSEDLLGVSNFEGYFVSINPAWEKLLGWTADEIKRMHVSALRHPDDAVHSMDGRAQLARGVPTVRMENRFRHRDGSWRWIHWTMTAESGLIYVSGRHVTSEKEAAAALERAQRQSAHSQKMEALGQLTGGVAHDFNNLLMIVSGHAEILKNRLADPKDRRALEAIQIAATRGESLTRQLLSFSRSQPLSPAVISLADTVRAIGDVLSGSLHVNIELAIDVPDATWPISVDKSEIELALVNLVVNARDAMPGGGRLAISAANVALRPADTAEGLAGDFVALNVADTGCGIPDDILVRVFEPFFTTKSAEKGTGLGLSQVYGFARRSGGTVAIRSQPNRGTTVTIYLPRSYAQIDLPVADDRVRVLAERAETVLIVEDNPDVRAVTVSLLEELGYGTTAVETAPAAFALLESGRDFSLVFTDVVLPGETDGLVLARSVRARYPHIPVVLTTGYARAFAADSEFPVLRKPYQIATLERVMREALGAAKAVRPALPAGSVH